MYNIVEFRLREDKRTEDMKGCQQMQRIEWRK